MHKKNTAFAQQESFNIFSKIIFYIYDKKN